MSGTWFVPDDRKLIEGMARSLERIADALDRLAPTDFADCSCKWVIDSYSSIYVTDKKCVLHGDRAGRIAAAKAEREASGTV